MDKDSQIMQLMADVSDALAKAAYWELAARRATAGAQASSKGAERLNRKVCRLRDEVKILAGRIGRLQHEINEQQKKISRLSLELLSKLSESTQHPK